MSDTDPDEEMTFRLANEHPALLARVSELEQGNAELHERLRREYERSSRLLARAEQAEVKVQAVKALRNSLQPDDTVETDWLYRQLGIALDGAE